MKRFSCLLLTALVTACVSDPALTSSVPPVRFIYEQPEQLQAGAQDVVKTFAAEVERARGGALAATPTVEVRNTPMLVLFAANTNTIVVPWWVTQPPEMRAVFRKFADGDDAEAEQPFRTFFNAFLLAHEAGHWYQRNANRREPTLYANENQANRLAVAFWRTQPGGEQYLARLEKLADRAVAVLPDPTPPGEDPVAYFGANYQALGRDPLKYGYYQFRFMAEALHDRQQLEFAKMVAR